MSLFFSQIILNQLIMKRKNFLKVAGTIGVGSMLPLSKIGNLLNAATLGEPPVACTLSPSETRGPFPLFADTAVASQTALVRSNMVGDYPIASGQTSGVPLTLTITVQNLNCTPVPNAKVYLWHCSKNGLYSGYSNAMNAGQAAYTYFRGIQTTDSNGQVTFQTIYPGWYNGRLPHFHVEAYVGNVLKHTSQFAFPLYTETAKSTYTVFNNSGVGVSANNYGYSIPSGASNTAYSADNVFSDIASSQILNPTGSISAGFAASGTFIFDQAVIPLELMSFKGGLENKQTKLWWTTANEVRISHFEIERSNHPSKNYQSIGQIKSQNQSNLTQYNFVDDSILTDDIMYYRLKINGLDGEIEYSKVVVVNRAVVSQMHLSPNPTKAELVLQHPEAYAATYVKFVTLDGRLMATGQIEKGVKASSFEVSWFPKGTYFLIVESGIDRHVFQFVKM